MDTLFRHICNDFEERYGHGWKKKLADVVGVSPSNVQSWIKAGRVPPAVATAIERYEEIEWLTDEIASLRANSVELVVFVDRDQLPYKVVRENEEEKHHEPIASFLTAEQAHDWLERNELETLASDLADELEQFGNLELDERMTAKVQRVIYMLSTPSLQRKKSKSMVIKKQHEYQKEVLNQLKGED